MTNTVVSIDGPSASGKSTVARQVALGLGYLYVDSGSVYRGVTWKSLESGVDVSDRIRVSRVVANIKMEFFIESRAVRFRIDGADLDLELRSKAVNDSVSRVAAITEVRKQVVAWLRDLVRFGDLVMEGRDIGTAVFPDAKYKFYLDADPRERARRRHAEMAQGIAGISVPEVSESLHRRDAIDSGREMDPLKVACGAVLVDSTSMSIDEVTGLILEQIARGSSEE